MIDGPLLWKTIKSLPKVRILTGLPVGRWAATQKQQWCAENLGEDIPVITCMARDKHTYCRVEGSILIDDNISARDAWVSAGGVFVHHVTAEQTILQLKSLGII
jgi:hypothetical protein